MIAEDMLRAALVAVEWVDVCEIVRASPAHASRTVGMLVERGLVRRRMRGHRTQIEITARGEAHLMMGRSLRQARRGRPKLDRTPIMRALPATVPQLAIAGVLGGDQRRIGRIVTGMARAGAVVAIGRASSHGTPIVWGRP